MRQNAQFTLAAALIGLAAAACGEGTAPASGQADVLAAETDQLGARSCSLANAPAPTLIDGLVFTAMAECVTFEAVTVALPAVFKVTLMLFVPLTSAALAGNAAFAS